MVSASDKGEGTVYVGKACQYWAAENGIKRTGVYYDVHVAVRSVHPISGDDTFSKCRCILASGATDISKTTVIEERTGNQSVKILNGYLNKKKFTLKFAGNNPKYDAYIHYTYDGR